MDSRLSRRALLAAAGVSVAGLAGCTAGYRTGTVDATAGLEPTRTPARTLDDAPLSATWTRELPGQFTLSTPGVDDDRLYVGSDTKLTAVALADGAVDWQVEMGGLTHGFTAAVDAGTVVGSARDIVGRQSIIDRGGTASLRALDADGGDEQWREPLAVSASPVVDDETVFVPLVDGEETAVTARDLDTGAELWTQTLSAPDIFATPAVGESVYVATTARSDETSSLLALSRDGELRWSKSLDGEAYKGPRVAPESDGETVYVGTDAGRLYAVDGDGDERWEATFEKAVNTTPAVDDERVYATTPRRVVALDRASGEGQWSGMVDHVAKTGLSVGGGMVHVGGNEVASFSAGDGAAQWRIELPGVAGTFGSPIFRDGTLYTGGCVKVKGSSLYDHTMYALE